MPRRRTNLHQRTLVKTYKSTYPTWLGGSAEKKFADDAYILEVDGWRVQSQSSTRIGLRRALTVTYVREEE
jgi:hypothetical protein